MSATDHAQNTGGSMLGSNQSGVRAHNERLVLSMLRRHGPLAKSDIARQTGLSAQTVSVIMRALEADGMLLRGQPRRGRVGQPSVPMRLAPGGAYFFGLTVGRRYCDLVLVDLTGSIRARARQTYDWPDVDAVLAFAGDHVARIERDLSQRERRRVAGIGIAMPFQLWNWADVVGVAPDRLAAWRHRDIADELADRTGLKVSLRNDASAACGAELVFGGADDLPPSFLHVYIAFFVGGGLVVDGRLYTGPSGNAAAIGSMPVPLPDGGTGQLIDVASLVVLSRAIAAAGRDIAPLWTFPLDWTYAEPEVAPWLDGAAAAIAHAAVAAAAIIDIEAVLIDGHMPAAIRARLTRGVDRRLDDQNLTGIDRPRVREGTIGADARSLGAASLPLATRFLV